MDRIVRMHGIVKLSVLTGFESFGSWIVQTTPVVDSMLSDTVEGPQRGFVEYRFQISEKDFLIVRVPIQIYNDSATGMTGETLFRMFYAEKFSRADEKSALFITAVF